MNVLQLKKSAQKSHVDVALAELSAQVSPDDTLPQAADVHIHARPTETFADIVARKVPEVDTGAFPAVRDPSELDHEDLWAVALSALDDRFEFADSIRIMDEYGEYGTLEEIDGLEEETEILFFRAPGGHPEVHDTDSYVDYLLGQEFLYNGSAVAWKNAREYLHVLDADAKNFESLRVGREGTDFFGARHKRPQAPTQPNTGHVPRHMSPVLEESVG